MTGAAHDRAGGIVTSDADLRDRGSASVVVVALSAVLALVAGVLVALGAVAVARHRAATAADLGALAAARQALEDPAAACARATGVVRAAGAQLVGCTVTGDVAEVEIALRPGGPLGLLGVAAARARAGPAAGPTVEPGSQRQDRLDSARARG